MTRTTKKTTSAPMREESSPAEPALYTCRTLAKSLDNILSTWGKTQQGTTTEAAVAAPEPSKTPAAKHVFRLKKTAPPSAPRQAASK